uniref:WD_REPEATS_REGION domain-containing protein n=1 Tax=Syphacia muris TaxID=451379 RepID=A0A158R4Z2_9BILA
MDNVGVGVSKPRFLLSEIIDAHRSDVKALDIVSTGQHIISGSRDETIKIFSYCDGKYVDSGYTKHNDQLAVNSLCVYESDQNSIVIFAGRKDGSIALFTMTDTNPMYIIQAHRLNVCVLNVDSINKKLLSGSWDSTANVWSIPELLNGDEKKLSLVGHKMSVWAIAAILDQPNYYLTGSADTVIKYWKNEQEIKSFSGHEDVIRSIVVINSKHFISAANDSSIRLWDLDVGICIRKFTSFAGEYIYGMKVITNGECNYVVSVGEGGNVEFWKLLDDCELEHVQLMKTPTQSIWTVSSLQNGDVVIGADDGKIYIFTTCMARKANDAAIEAYDAHVAEKIAFAEAQRAAQEQGVIKIKVSLDDGHPNMELRYKKGSDPVEAAETFITENNLPITFLDEIVDYIKTNIPEARNAANKKYKVQPTQRVNVDGEEWDYVFDVKNETGKVMKLTYNVGEDVNWAAQRFVEKNNLPIQFLEKVSRLLRTQVPGFKDEAPSDYTDPFTGGNRYVPSSSGSNNVTETDPFTGSGRYIPPTAEGSQTALSSRFIDPFTGEGAYRATDAHTTSFPKDPIHPRSDLIPLRQLVKFGLELSSVKAITKLKELNDAQVEYRLNTKQLGAMEDILTTMSYEVRDVHIAAIDLCLCWPIDALVPVLDAFRLALLNSTLNKIFCHVKTEDGMKARGMSTMQKLSALLLTAQKDPIKIFICRAIANAAAHPWGKEMLMHDIKTNISLLAMQLTSSKAALQMAAVGALENYAFLLSQTNIESGVTELGPREDAMKALVQSLHESRWSDVCGEITQVHLLKTIGTLMWGDKTTIKVAKNRDVASIVNRIKDSVPSEDGKAVARDILGMIYAV